MTDEKASWVKWQEHDKWDLHCPKLGTMAVVCKRAGRYRAVGRDFGTLKEAQRAAVEHLRHYGQKDLRECERRLGAARSRLRALEGL